MYKFSQKSEARLSKAHPDLILIMVESLKVSYIDFGISQTARSFDDQLEYFLLGVSALDPRIPEKLACAKHVITDDRPLAEAADIYIYVKGYPNLQYDFNHLCQVAGVIQTTAKHLHAQGRVEHLIRWGGNWDSDGCILKDQNFQDLPHFELIKP